jgi:hypothetical protein
VVEGLALRSHGNRSVMKEVPIPADIHPEDEIAVK